MKEYRDLNETVLTNGDIIDINQTVNGVNTFVILFRDNKLCVKYWMNNKPGQDYEYDKEDLLKEIYDGSVEWVIVDNIGSYNLTPEDLYSIKETVAQATRSKYRGHNIIFTSNGWIFESSKQLVENNKNIKCGHCSKQRELKDQVIHYRRVKNLSHEGFCKLVDITNNDLVSIQVGVYKDLSENTIKRIVGVIYG